MRVLVVEDEVRLAATLQDLLELNGYTVDVCHDGEAGLDNALTSIYDVVRADGPGERAGLRCGLLSHQAL